MVGESTPKAVSTRAEYRRVDHRRLPHSRSGTVDDPDLLTQ